MGFASDVLGDFDTTSDELRITLARATRYATDVHLKSDQYTSRPTVDCGELKFNLCLFDDPALADQATDVLLNPPTAMIAPATRGDWARRSSLGHLTPDSMRLLTLEHIASHHLRVRIQNRNTKKAEALLTLGKSRIKLGPLGPQEIRTFVLEEQSSGAWKEDSTSSSR